MDKQVTFGHVLTIVLFIVVPLIIWGSSIETRFGQVIENTKEIEELKVDSKLTNIMIQNNHIEVMKQFTEVKVELQDKKNR